ncbi:MAG TPA: hypothetical protein VN676_01650 [Steroidobacteraceae bacterium]|nr:hypothetical protein [Steroidobacteraceae bacterium]
MIQVTTPRANTNTMPTTHTITGGSMARANSPVRSSGASTCSALISMALPLEPFVASTQRGLARGLRNGSHKALLQRAICLGPTAAGGELAFV